MALLIPDTEVDPTVVPPPVSKEELAKTLGVIFTDLRVCRTGDGAVWWWGSKNFGKLGFLVSNLRFNNRAETWLLDRGIKITRDEHRPTGYVLYMSQAENVEFESKEIESSRKKKKALASTGIDDLIASMPVQEARPISKSPEQIQKIWDDFDKMVNRKG